MVVSFPGFTFHLLQLEVRQSYFTWILFRKHQNPQPFIITWWVSLRAKTTPSFCHRIRRWLGTRVRVVASHARVGVAKEKRSPPKTSGEWVVDFRNPKIKYVISYMLHVNYYMNILLNVVQKWLVIGQSVKLDMEQYTNLVTSLRSESGTLCLTSMPMGVGFSSLVFAWWNSITWDLQRFNHVASGSFEWNLKNTPRCLDIVVFSFLQSWTMLAIYTSLKIFIHLYIFVHFLEGISGFPILVAWTPSSETHGFSPAARQQKDLREVAFAEALPSSRVYIHGRNFFGPQKLGVVFCCQNGQLGGGFQHFFTSSLSKFGGNDPIWRAHIFQIQVGWNHQLEGLNLKDQKKGMKNQTLQRTEGIQVGVTVLNLHGWAQTKMDTCVHTPIVRFTTVRPLEFPGHIYSLDQISSTSFGSIVLYVLGLFSDFEKGCAISIYFYLFLRFWVTYFYRHDQLFICLLSKLCLSLCFGWIPPWTVPALRRLTGPPGTSFWRYVRDVDIREKERLNCP